MAGRKESTHLFRVYRHNIHGTPVVIIYTFQNYVYIVVVGNKRNRHCDARTTTTTVVRHIGRMHVLWNGIYVWLYIYICLLYSTIYSKTFVRIMQLQKKNR